VLLSKGEKAEVEPGAEFGMMVERSFTVNTDTFGVSGDRYDNDQSPSNYDSIRAAQLALRDKGFYSGPINGEMSLATRNAIRDFQRDRNLSITGDLDARTARELGIMGDGRLNDGRSNDGHLNDGRTGPGPATGIGNPRQLSSLADRLFQDYQRDLNIRSNRGEVVFDARRNFKENEVELLFQFAAVRAAAELYSQMAVNVTDSDALKGAADSLIRQVRLANRAMRRSPNMALSSVVASDWDQLRAGLRGITVTDNDLDTDTIR
jgi:peptidoglycan hydrolase-like protein with peptidoglycan-binding domain